MKTTTNADANLEAEASNSQSAAAPLAAPIREPKEFITFEQLCERVPYSPRKLRDDIKAEHIPSIRLPGDRRLIFHWPSVQNALLRQQRGFQAVGNLEPIAA